MPNTTHHDTQPPPNTFNHTPHPHTFIHTPHQSYGFTSGEQFNFDSQQPHQEDNRQLSFALNEEELLYNTFDSRHNTLESATQLLNNMCQQNFQIPSFWNAYTPLNQISNWTQGGSSSSAAIPPRHPPHQEDKDQEEEEQQQETRDVPRRRQNPVRVRKPRQCGSPDSIGSSDSIGSPDSIGLAVGNELGAGKPYKAKLAAMVALGCAFVMGFINVAWTVILRYGWAALFTNDEPVKALVASVMPIMGLCELGNCPQTTGCGILRGTARPVIAANINLGSFYFVGTPVAVGLAFWFKFGFSGLWFGLLSAQVACALSILYVVVVRTDWEAEALKAEKLTRGVEMGNWNGSKNKDKMIDDEENKGLLVYGNGNKIDI
uniref:Uncharacterized protein LOC113785478 n=2 Tax=Cicer arietinum TaxID=3827 RepID=A0A3Q7YCY8_CICAR|nr:uncharacterized protein LOC113785478 [Cicer arietinum]